MERQASTAYPRLLPLMTFDTNERLEGAMFSRLAIASWVHPFFRMAAWMSAGCISYRPSLLLVIRLHPNE